MHKDDTQALSRSKEARPFSMVAEPQGTRGIRGSEEKPFFGLDFLSIDFFRLLWTDLHVLGGDGHRF